SKGKNKIYAIIVKYYFLIFLSVCTFIDSENSICQSLVYENYTVNNGLPSQAVNYAFEDSRGFMWFATDAGVSRFDGLNFTNFTTQQGLSDNEVFSMAEDSRKRLWFLTSNGKLSYLYNGVFYNPDNDSTASQASGNSGFFSFLEDNNNNVWLSTLSGQLICIQHNGMVSRFEAPELKAGINRLNFYQTTDNELWIITGHLFYKFDSGEFIPLTGPEISAIGSLPFYNISKGDALFLSPKGLERIINKNYGIIIPNIKIPFHDKAVRLYYTSFHDIWITNQSDNTLYFKYDKGTYLPYRTYFKGNSVSFVYADREKNTWFCSATNGIFKLPAQSFSNRSITVEDGLSQNSVSCISIDRDSMLWLGFSNGTVNRISPNKIELFDCNFNNQNNNRIIKIIPDRENNIWAATNNGLFLIKKIYNKKYAPPFFVKLINGTGNYSCKNISIDSNEIIASWQNGIGIVKYTDHGYALSSFKLNLETNHIYGHFKDRTGKLWLSDISGVCYIEKDSLLCFTTSDITSNRISDISTTSDGTLVLATHGEGILFFKNGRVTARVNSTNGLSGNICKKLFITGDTIYVITDKGLSRFLFTENAEYRPENFTASEGVLSNAVNDLMVHNGTIYIATSEGLSLVPVAVNRSIADPPPLYIISFKVNSSLMDSLNNNKLSYDRQHLQFSFVAPTFDHPEMLMYQYKLSGLHEEWVETKNKTVEFSALDPGKYIFQLRAKKYNSDWSKPEVLKFEITAPIWGTLVFRLVVANSLILVLYFLLNNIVSRKYRRQLALYEQQRALQLERNRISTDMHDDLGADLTNIVILTKIASKTIKLEGEQKSKLEKIATASNDVINKMNEIIWALNPANDTLRNLISYLHRYAKEYLDLNERKISIKIPTTVPDVSLKAAYRRNIFLILKESLHNIVKHSGADNVEIEININNERRRFNLNIKDNGKGFSVSDKTGSGNGLLNMRKRMTEIKGVVNIESSVGHGSVVKVTAAY
ncbi:MAG: two-component regulator propeller domain-containing protein, partial [Bacteroidia bacterium]